ncbi:hypothetical protein J1N35_032452 [Gossypium stocksii]|uniref:Uncharacterized protein n=1 Tax=Gossypium stocksii TaxID=47602 RepID=A0A9D3ZW97_9ROSI|nr:hypothetical protein J1N35_032452 [Gossypium stocksii]
MKSTLNNKKDLYYSVHSLKYFSTFMFFWSCLAHAELATKVFLFSFFYKGCKCRDWGEGKDPLLQPSSLALPVKQFEDRLHRHSFYLQTNSLNSTSANHWAINALHFGC